MDTSLPRSRRSPVTDAPRAGLHTLATIEIDSVIPSPRGFTLTGQGSDRMGYRLDVHFDLPLDPRTRAVLGELLSQSDLTVYRSDTPPATSR